jgi:hypothetical protein
MLARLQRRFRQRKVGVVRGGDDHQIDIRVVQQFPAALTTFTPGQSAWTLPASLLETVVSAMPGVPPINGA